MIKWLTTLIFISLFISSEGQTLISGIVMDEKNNPLPDAHVFTKSGKTYSHTNAMGKFEMDNLTAGDTIMVSFLGFNSIQYVLSSEDFKSEIAFRMNEAIFELNQVSISNALNSIKHVKIWEYT